MIVNFQLRRCLRLRIHQSLRLLSLNKLGLVLELLCQVGQVAVGVALRELVPVGAPQMSVVTLRVVYGIRNPSHAMPVIPQVISSVGQSHGP